MMAVQRQVAEGAGSCVNRGLRGQRRLNLTDPGTPFSLIEWCRPVRDAPHRFEWGGISDQTWDQVPVNMGNLVAQEFVIDLPCAERIRQHLCDACHFFDQSPSLLRRKLKELGRVVIQHQDGPTREKLVVMQISCREPAVGDLMLPRRPGSGAHLARWIAHG